MRWMNAIELKEKYKGTPLLDSFYSIFPISSLMNNCLLHGTYKPKGKISEYITLTDYGAKWAEYLQQNINGISESEIKCTSLMKLAHLEFLIDLSNCDTDSIREMVSHDIVAGQIKFPWIFDHILYDRFFDLFPNQTEELEELNEQDTFKLLDGTPQGVFQIRNNTVGPYGVLESYEQRLISPRKDIHLWHCSDPSCSAMHIVKLNSGSCNVLNALKLLNTKATEAEGNPSEWSSLFFSVMRTKTGTNWYHDNNPANIALLLGNSFSEKELQQLLLQLLVSFSKKIRSRLPNTKKINNLFSASPNKVATSLNKAECFQLILILSDESICTCLDSLINQGVIRIPTTEKRTLDEMRLPGGAYNIIWEASRFGVRPESVNSDLSFARLRRLIKLIYQEDVERLNWKLKYIDGKNDSERLYRYLHTEDPHIIVKELIFDNQAYVEKAHEILKYGAFWLSTSIKEEEYLIERILWKLGFESKPDQPNQRLFWERLHSFSNAAKKCNSRNEKDKELIRGAGVNFFVSLEEILSNSLFFITWALILDHYGLTKFKYDPEEALVSMVQFLNEQQADCTEPLVFDSSGKNTLFPLIRGFALLHKICKDIMAQEGNYRRQETELPGYHNKSSIEDFPFLHKALILDLIYEEAEEIMGLLAKIAEDFEKSNACSIRNGIDHQSKIFPDSNKIIDCCSAVEEIISYMEHEGICPIIYFYSGMHVDSNGRTKISFKNYKMEECVIYRPYQYPALPLPSLLAPQIIVPCIHIGDSIEPVRFEYQENSDYVKIWQNYPRRRKGISPADQSNNNMAEAPK